MASRAIISPFRKASAASTASLAGMASASAIRSRPRAKSSAAGTIRGRLSRLGVARRCRRACTWLSQLQSCSGASACSIITSTAM
jgi:hypothetical protein